MSKIAKVVKEERSDKVYNKEMTAKKAVVNHMNGISYEVNPLLTLKMITASSIFGEPQYYRQGAFAEKNTFDDGLNGLSSLFSKYAVLLLELTSTQKPTSQIMEEAVDAALDYDFGGTLAWALELRQNYNMRLNPQVIMVRAASHPARQAYTASNPGVFADYQQKVMMRADEPASQFAYYLFKNKGIQHLPNLLKKSWAKRISYMTRYEFGKYKNKGLGLIDVIRVSHAKGELVDELVRTGTIVTSENEKTWEHLKASGKKWDEIVTAIKLPHMALLRNLRGIFTEIKDTQLMTRLLGELKSGVKKGKQFPFAYKTAADVVEQCKEIEPSEKGLINQALNDCVDISAAEMPKLKGKTACLSDNSGSAHGSFTSEFGKVSVADIGNLSSVITARNSDEGHVGIFGDELVMMEVHANDAIIDKAKEADKIGKTVGGGTENGVWLFFDKALREKEHWDNIFIYSDMQAGHGGLYGRDEDEYKEFVCNRRYIDVAKLIDTYRKRVNPKVNVFCVQTAGYTNTLVPEYGYRTNILYGWTGKELIFADKMNQLWDEYDANQNN